MIIQIDGSGAREHALGWKLRQEPGVSGVIFCPGNAGIAKQYRCIKPPEDTVAGHLHVAKQVGANLMVIGPEQLLVNGIVDEAKKLGIPVFGPSQQAALITEGSKIACKKLLVAAGVPTVEYYVHSTIEVAREYIQSHPTGRMVVKADGLAAGKGVVVCNSRAEALAAVHRAMELREFGAAGERVLIEELEVGDERSFIVITDGTTATPLLLARDYKRQFDGDRGKMTGGMGAYAPALLDEQMVAVIMADIVYPTLKELKKLNIRYQGAMYFGLMLTKNGPKVLEINCRFGDPETQVILPLLKSSLLELMWAACVGDRPFASIQPVWRDEHAVGIVLAAPGYGEKPITGKRIAGFAQAEGAGALLFHAGVRSDNEECLVTDGGRVTTVVGLGETRELARTRAYQYSNFIEFEGGKMFRSDIAA